LTLSPKSVKQKSPCPELHVVIPFPHDAPIAPPVGATQRPPSHWAPNEQSSARAHEVPHVPDGKQRLIDVPLRPCGLAQQKSATPHTPASAQICEQ
jgi:hypothetical protein